MHLQDLGWNAHHEENLEPFRSRGLEPGRVASENHEIYTVHSERGVLTGELTGRCRFRAASRADLPAVGDWVALEAFPRDGTCVIHEVLPRRTAVVRRAAGPRPEVQVLAANVDTVFIVTAPLPALNARSVERYVTLVHGSGAGAVVVVSKMDLVDDVREILEAANRAAAPWKAVAYSAVTGEGLERLRAEVPAGRTAALLGASGSGKSTLVNALAGEAVRQVGAVRASDGRGRHTTASRDLILLRGGGLLIDTPGLREVGTLGDPEALGETFEDILELAGGCRFRDCRHETEPGCAVHEAVVSGRLDAGRLAGYGKLRREEVFTNLRASTTAAFAERTRWKGVTKRLKKSPPPP